MLFYYHHSVKRSFDDAITAITDALKKEGFGILTRIDIAEKFKEKLGIDFRKYVILGACNPPLAYQALQAEDKIGVMLPCNVIVQELMSGEVEVAAIDPKASMSAVGNPALEPVAQEVSARLKRAVDSI